MVSLFYLEFLQLQSSSNHRSQIFIVLFDICVAFDIYFTTTLALWLLIHTPKNSLIHKGLLLAVSVESVGGLFFLYLQMHCH